jgi:tetratricopeptide (TPR) repeat protein
MAQQGIPLPEVADPGQNSGAAIRPLPLLQPLPPRPWWPPPRRTAAVLLAGAALALPMAWFLGRPQLARWQLQRGDEAFLAFAKVPDDEAWLQQAGAAWQRARLLDPRLAAAYARLAFLADFLDDPVTAEAAWKRAIDLERASSPQAKAYRNGLANVLAQQPARRQEALAIYDGDNDDPRSAIEAAMRRWPRPAELPRGLDAVSRPDLAASLAGKASGVEPPWGFKMPDGELLLFETRAERRCLLDGVRGATAHLAGEAAPAPPLAATDCQGIRSSVKDLLCNRLKEASRGNPRAAGTARWLGCPPPATGTPATDGGKAS